MVEVSQEALVNGGHDANADEQIFKDFGKLIVSWLFGATEEFTHQFFRLRAVEV